MVANPTHLRLRDRAKDLIAAHGRDMELVTTTEGAFDPIEGRRTPGTTTRIPIKGVFQARVIEATRLGEPTQVVRKSVIFVSEDPLPDLGKSHVAIGGVRFAISEVISIEPGEVAIMYELELET